MEPAREGNADYWNKYYYWPTNKKSERMGHNLHHADHLREEVRALLQLYKVQIMGIVAGEVHVLKWFRRADGHHPNMISAANEAPLDASLEEWQKLCKSLLDYAIRNGYKETLK